MTYLKTVMGLLGIILSAERMMSTDCSYYAIIKHSRQQGGVPVVKYALIRYKVIAHMMNWNILCIKHTVSLTNPIFVFNLIIIHRFDPRRTTNFYQILFSLFFGRTECPYVISQILTKLDQEAWTIQITLIFYLF